MKTHQTVDQGIEFKAISAQINVDEAEGIVECFVSGVGNKDSVGDIVLPGAFTESLKRRKPRVVWGHDWNHPIGKVLEIYEVPASDRRLPAKMKQAGIGGLFAKVQFNLRSEKGREAFANVSFYGEDQEWSIGYKTLDAIYDNQRQANLLREVELYEVSPVLHGANQLTGTISIKSDNPEDEEVDSFQKSKWKMFDRSFAERIKEEYPEIWAKGGNIKGNAQYSILTKIAKNGGVAETPDQKQALKLREAWVARHEQDFRLPGVIAQMKWLAVGSRGENYMKNVVNEAIKKMKAQGKSEQLLDESDEENWADEAEKGVYDKPKDDWMKVLRSELARRHGAPIDLREVAKNVVVYAVLGGAAPKVLRQAYHFDGQQFMFGEPEAVRPEMVYLPLEDGDEEMWGEEEEKNCGCGCKGSCGSKPRPDVLDSLKDAQGADIEEKVGRAINASNMGKLRQAMDLINEVISAGGRTEIEMKSDFAEFGISAPSESLYDLKSFIDPVLDYYAADVEVVEDGIVVKSVEGSHGLFVEALENAVASFKKTVALFESDENIF